MGPGAETMPRRLESLPKLYTCLWRWAKRKPENGKAEVKKLTTCELRQSLYSFIPKCTVLTAYIKYSIIFNIKRGWNLPNAFVGFIVWVVPKFSNMFRIVTELSSGTRNCSIRYWVKQNSCENRGNIVEMTNNMHRFAPLLYSIYRLLHVSAVVCHYQGASGYVRVTWKYRLIRHTGHLTNIIWYTTKSICIFM
jgi:hypothetical protein